MADRPEDQPYVVVTKYGEIFEINASKRNHASLQGTFIPNFSIAFAFAHGMAAIMKERLDCADDVLVINETGLEEPTVFCTREQIDSA